jgi:phage tail-like protein
MPHRTKHTYHLIVEWGGTRMNFTEVSGLNITVDVNEFREGGDLNQAPHKLPGLIHYSNIVLKRGIAPNDNDFINWINTSHANNVERRDITIKLLNEHYDPVVSWKVIRAFPVKFTGPMLHANSNDIAVEELELTHEGLMAGG